MKLLPCLFILLTLWSLGSQSSPIFVPPPPSPSQKIYEESIRNGSTPPNGNPSHNFVPSQADTMTTATTHRKPDLKDEDYYLLIDPKEFLSDYELYHKEGPLYLYDTDEELESPNSLLPFPQRGLDSRDSGIQSSFLDEAFPYVVGGAIALLASSFLTNRVALDSSENRLAPNAGLLQVPTLDTMFPFLHNLVRKKREATKDKANEYEFCSQRFVCEMKDELLGVLGELDGSNGLEEILLGIIGSFLSSEMEDLNWSMPCTDIACGKEDGII